MKNVKSANYWQIDHKIKNILGIEGVVVLPSAEAWQKFKWVKSLFKEKPKEGYFLWVKKQISFPLTTCITIASPKISQNLTNLLVIEKGLRIKANITCNAAENNLYGSHKAKGKMILKEGASLEYSHFHQWGEKDFVSPDYEFILEKDSKLVYTYKNLLPPENLILKTTIYSGKNSSSNINFLVNAINSKIRIQDTLILEGGNSQGIVKLRLVARKKSDIEAISEIVAKNIVKGHLDCQGLLVDKDSKISLAPKLLCQNKNAQLTHEASIGRIAEEQLIYLRMRGLTQDEAIKLIVTGFLEIK
ncbi:MAG: SufD family Fe-S cluster assembly protein [Patescibacteria group bacterium]|nr:SufD family Fe-S cluster assembly protein [Patescibacteria group bacterium]